MIPMIGAMIRALVLSFCLLCGAAVAAPAAETRFLSGLNDVPLMDGLVELRERQTLFDAPGGRIVDLYAEGAVPAARIIAFYAQSLPQLGWSVAPAGGKGPLRLTRDGESLVISARTGSTTLVHFSLKPR